MNNYFLLDKKSEIQELLDKILIFGVLAIVVITSASISGIMVARSYNQRLIAEYYSQKEEIQEKNIEESKAQEDNEEELKTLPLPVYSDAAKNRMENIYVSNSEEKIAYLTFDDGPSANITPQILQTLENEGVKATFFVLGSRTELYPELVKEEYEAGHYIANHGYSHVYTSVYSSPNAVLDEYNRTENAIRQAIGNENYTSYLFRFPGGSEGGKYAKVKNEAKSLLEQNNIAYINWNALTRDAEGKPTKESLVSDLKATAAGKDKIVVLMHDTGTKQLTADTLPEVIAYLREQGYVFKNFYDIMY